VLIRYWLPRLSQQCGKCSATIEPGAIRCLKAYRWPGNARELRHVLEHSLCLSVSNVLTERDVQSVMLRGPADACEPSGSPHLRDRLYLELAANHWNRTETARRLGVGRTTLWRWLRKDAAKRDERP
jgi:transcriptional regulator of acetoin/glycerol metabolism